MLHHERLTPTQQASIEHRARLHANIAARAALVNKPKPVAIAPPAPEPETVISSQIADLTSKLEALRAAKPETFHRPLVNRIQEAVAHKYGLTRADILSLYRGAAIVRPRHIAMYISRKMTQQSWHLLAAKFGGRDHTTLINAVRKIELARSVDSQLNDEINDLIMSLSKYEIARF